MSHLHDKYVVVPADKATKNIVLCVHHITFAKKEFTINLATLHISRRHLRKRKSWEFIGLCHVPLEFHPRMKNWIFRYSTGFLNYASVLTISVCIAGFAKCSTKLISKLLTSVLSAVKTGFRVTVTLYGFWLPLLYLQALIKTNYSYLFVNIQLFTAGIFFGGGVFFFFGVKYLCKNVYCFD